MGFPGHGGNGLRGPAGHISNMTAITNRGAETGGGIAGKDKDETNRLGGALDSAFLSTRCVNHSVACPIVCVHLIQQSHLGTTRVALDILLTPSNKLP